MAMVNMNNLLNGKDSRWLQLEVCREFQRNKCSRPDTECKFAHPPANVEVQNGRVTACYDSIKGRCNREKPPCKYFHPPQHLKDQLLINGRNHLALKNAIMQQMGLTPGQPLVPGQVPTVAANPYLTGMPQVGSTYSPYFAPGPLMPAIMGPDPSVGSPLGVVPQTVVAQQKMPRSDRLEMDVKSVGSFYYENFCVPQAFSGMMPYKRPAADKSGMPVYQPSATTYQQLMQLQQQPFVPVSCEYTSPPPVPPTSQTQVTQVAVGSASSAVSSCASPAVAATAQTAVNVTAIASTVTAQTDLQPAKTPNQVQQELAVAHAQAAAAAAAAHAQAENDTVVNSAAVQPPLPPNALDAAAIAKEVAQQNYAKAVKLAQVSQSYGFNSALALNYTGVALNKQQVALPPPAIPRYSTLPFAFTGATAQVPTSMGLTGLPQNPYAPAQAAQQNLFAFSRPPPPVINPYSFLRPYSTPTATPAPTFLQAHQNHLLAAAAAAQYPQITQQVAIQQTPVSVAMPVQTNNNNVVLQPYKKMKTT